MTALARMRAPAPNIRIRRFWERLLSPRDAVDRAVERVLKQRWNKETVRFVYSWMANPKTAEVGWLLLGVRGAKGGLSRLEREAFAKVSDRMLLRYALPMAVAALAESDPERAKALLRQGRKRWSNRKGLSAGRCLQLATAGAYLGDADSVESFTAGLTCPEADDLKRKFAEQRRTARHLGVSADYASVRNAALSLPSRGTRAELVVSGDAQKIIPALPPDFPLAVAAEDGPVWLPVRGSLGERTYPAQNRDSFDFPFPGNVRPLFLDFHIADMDILGDAGPCGSGLAYLRRFAPIGCRDLFTARLLRGAGVKAFVGKSEVVSGDAQKVIVPKPVRDAIAEGQSERKIYALWRKATAKAVKRTDALIAEQNARYRLPNVSLSALGLDRIAVRTFGEEASGDAVHLLFAFDENLAEHFPGTLEGVWRNATRPLVVHVLGRGLNAAMFERWAAQFARSGAPARACPHIRFTWRDLSGFAYGDDLRLNPGTTVSTMDRLLAPELLPDLERVLWLDVDVLVRADVSDLFDIALGDAPLAACRHNRQNRKFFDMPKKMNDLLRQRPEEQAKALHNAFFTDGPTIFQGFNEGVTVMNLARMRRERATQKMLALVAAGRFNDGKAFNLYARGRWKPLARTWNHMPEQEVMANPAIVHFLGPAKPWEADMHAPFMKDWLENAERARARGARP